MTLSTAATALSHAATPPYEGLVEALHLLARRIHAQEGGAAQALGALMAVLEGHPDPRCVGLYVFAAGLARRLGEATAGSANLYLAQFEVPQIELFNLLGRALPFVGMATQIANGAIAHAMADQARPTIIDVGIGTGRQCGLLLEQLAAEGSLPRLLTVIGIEPSAWALDAARAHIEQTAAALGAEVSFFGLPHAAEDLGEREWRQVQQACTARPLVNASFALHHIADGADGADGRDRRGEVLRRLNALDPALLVLAEPDVDHLEGDFLRRFANCWQHFGAVFRTLDRLPLAQRERDAIKVGFFGREIADILGAPEGQRSERHESAAQWLARLRDAGFDAAPAARCAAGMGGAGVVSVQRQRRHVALHAEGVPVVSIFTATPRPLPVGRVARVVPAANVAPARPVVAAAAGQAMAPEALLATQLP